VARSCQAAAAAASGIGCSRGSLRSRLGLNEHVDAAAADDDAGCGGSLVGLCCIDVVEHWLDGWR